MKLIAYNREEEEEKLFAFTLLMGDAEGAFIAAARRQGYQLAQDHPLESLEELERYGREKQLSFDDSTDAALLERMNCWYYLGEVMRTNYGGYWRFSMNTEDTSNWGQYVVEGYGNTPGAEFEPQGLFRRWTYRSYPTGALRKAIDAYVKPQALDLSNIPNDPS